MNRSHNVGQFVELLRERLGRRQRTWQEHPGSGALAGFAARTLPVRERREIADHLATCADCREVLALATMAAPGLPTKTRNGGGALWWRAAAVGAAVCTLLVVFREQPIQNLPVPKPPASIAQPVHPAKTLTPAPALKKEVHTRPRPAVRPTFSGGPQPKMETPAQALPGPEQAMARARVFRPEGFKADPQGMLSNSFVSGRVAAAPLPPRVSKYLWKLTPLGTLMRSGDGGVSWEELELDRGELLALSADGSDIWAGGAGSRLFHSTDGGLHWTRVPVKDGDGELNDAIVSIAASGSLTVTVTTRALDQWISTDGGEHWRLRR